MQKNYSRVEIIMSKEYYLVPKQDITAYETAQCVAFLMLTLTKSEDPVISEIRNMVVENSYAVLEENVKRNLMQVDLEDPNAMQKVLARAQEAKEEARNAREEAENGKQEQEV